MTTFLVGPASPTRGIPPGLPTLHLRWSPGIFTYQTNIGWKGVSSENQTHGGDYRCGSQPAASGGRALADSRNGRPSEQLLVRSPGLADVQPRCGGVAVQ